MFSKLTVGITVVIFAIIINYLFTNDYEILSKLRGYSLTPELSSPTRCSETGSLFKLKKSYFYKYAIKPVGFNNQSEDELIDISCDVVVHAIGQCQFILNTKKCVLQGQQNGSFQLFSSDIDKYPLQFSLFGDEIGSIFAHKNENLIILNFKRGIISAFNTVAMNSLKDVSTITKKLHDTHGNCTASYNLESQSIVYSKKDIFSCSSVDFLWKLKQSALNCIWEESCRHHYVKDELKTVSCVDSPPSISQFFINFSPLFNRSLNLISYVPLIKQQLPNEAYRLTDIDFEFDKSSLSPAQIIDNVFGSLGFSNAPYNFELINDIFKNLPHVFQYDGAEWKTILSNMFQTLPWKKISLPIIHFIKHDNFELIKNETLRYIIESLRTKASVIMHTKNILETKFDFATILPTLHNIINSHAGLPLKIDIDSNISFASHLNDLPKHGDNEEVNSNVDLKVSAELNIKEYVDFSTFHTFGYINRIKFETLNNINVYLPSNDRVIIKIKFLPISQQSLKFSKQSKADDSSDQMIDFNNKMSTTHCNDLFLGFKICRLQVLKSHLKYYWIEQTENQLSVDINVNSAVNDSLITNTVQLSFSDHGQVIQLMMEFQYSFNSSNNLRRIVFDTPITKVVFLLNYSDNSLVRLEVYDKLIKNEKPYYIEFSQSITDFVVTIGAPELSWIVTIKQQNYAIDWAVQKHFHLNGHPSFIYDFITSKMDTKNNNNVVEAEINWLPGIVKTSPPLLLKSTFQPLSGQWDFVANFTNYNRTLVSQVNCTNRLSHKLEVVDNSNFSILKLFLQFPLQFSVNPFTLDYNFTSDIYSFLTRLIWDSTDKHFTKIDFNISAQSILWNWLNVDLKQHVKNGGETMEMKHDLMDINVEGTWRSGYHKKFTFNSKMASVIPSMQWKLDCESIYYCLAKIIFTDPQMDALAIAYELSMNEKSLSFTLCRNDVCRSSNDSIDFILRVELNLLDSFTIGYTITVDPTVYEYLMSNMNTVYNNIVTELMSQLAKDDHPVHLIKNIVFGNLTEEATSFWKRLSEIVLTDLIIIFRPIIPIIENAMKILYLFHEQKAFFLEQALPSLLNVVIQPPTFPGSVTTFQLPFALNNFTSVKKPWNINPKLMTLVF
ncbi:hypothetical protein CHUAL_013688 [Chamberlinius hualienensis]